MRAIAHQLLNILLPPRCIACGVQVQEAHNVCGVCWKELEFISDPRCGSCGFPLEEGAKTGSMCGYCIQHTPPYDAGISILAYNNISKKLISEFKYADRQHGLPRFVQWMSSFGRPVLESADIIAPVPMHWRRMLARSFNQSALLASAIAKKHKISYQPQLLRRVKHIPPQASLTRKQRLKNIKGAFILNARYKGRLKDKHIVLIDDVITTGATMKECAKALKKSGAAKVSFLTLARVV